MDIQVRPEAQQVIDYALSGIFTVLVASGAVYLVAFALCYLVSLACHCANVWPAGNRATLVAKYTAWTTAALLLVHAVIVSDPCLCVLSVGGLMIVIAALIYALFTVPRQVRAYRQDQEEWEQRKAGWQHHDQQNCLAG